MDMEIRICTGTLYYGRIYIGSTLRISYLVADPDSSVYAKCPNCPQQGLREEGGHHTHGLLPLREEGR